MCVCVLCVYVCACVRARFPLLFLTSYLPSPFRTLPPSFSKTSATEWIQRMPRLTLLRKRRVSSTAGCQHPLNPEKVCAL